jgi:hypothetical protein
VRIDVDNFVGPLLVANTPRPDLVSWIGSANHGFAIAAPLLSEGTHTLTFRVRDPLTDTFTAFATTELTY